MVQVFILLIILYFLPQYNCYLNNFYYTRKKNFITFKTSLYNNNESSNKKLYDDYSNFLNYKKKVTYVDLNNISKNNTNAIKNNLFNSNENVIILYNSNSNTKTILRNIKDILKY